MDESGCKYAYQYFKPNKGTTAKVKWGKATVAYKTDMDFFAGHLGQYRGQLTAMAVVAVIPFKPYIFTTNFLDFQKDVVSNQNLAGLKPSYRTGWQCNRTAKSFVRWGWVAMLSQHFLNKGLLKCSCIGHFLALIDS